MFIHRAPISYDHSAAAIQLSVRKQRERSWIVSVSLFRRANANLTERFLIVFEIYLKQEKIWKNNSDKASCAEENEASSNTSRVSEAK